MKAGIHPDYRPVLFRDVSNGASFLIGSTLSKRFGSDPTKGSTVRKSRPKPPAPRDGQAEAE